MILESRCDNALWVMLFSEDVDWSIPVFRRHDGLCRWIVAYRNLGGTVRDVHVSRPLVRLNIEAHTIQSTMAAVQDRRDVRFDTIRARGPSS